MNLYISDMHLGHKNVIGFDNRPFTDVIDMENSMINLWNESVDKDDDVWIIGDFCYRSDKDATYYLKKLRGRKHLIIGNHDKVTLENEAALGYFESVEMMSYINDNGKDIVMCHFPIAEWSRMKRGSWHIYGHIHCRKDDTYNFMKTRERALNAGCMINNYRPVSFEELIKNNQIFNLIK